MLKISTSLQTWLASETHLVDGEALRVAVNRERFVKLQGSTWIAVISKRNGGHFKLERTEINNGDHLAFSVEGWSVSCQDFKANPQWKHVVWSCLPAAHLFFP